MVHCSVLINKVKAKSDFWHFNTTLLADRNSTEAFFGLSTGRVRGISPYNSGGMWASAGSDNYVNSILSMSAGTEPGQ